MIRSRQERELKIGPVAPPYPESTPPGLVCSPQGDLLVVDGTTNTSETGDARILEASRTTTTSLLERGVSARPDHVLHDNEHFWLHTCAIWMRPTSRLLAPASMSAQPERGSAAPAGWLQHNIHMLCRGEEGIVGFELWVKFFDVMCTLEITFTWQTASNTLTIIVCLH
jgi:hypothetical protein